MDTKEEGLHCVYKEGELIAIVKRDEVVKKHLVYMVKEADSTDIVGLFKESVLKK